MYRSVRFAVTVATLCLSLFVSACSGSGGAQPASRADLASLKAAANAPPPLQPGEKINLIVYGEPTLSGEYRVDPSGFVSLPVIGTMKAAGLTPQGLGDKLVAALRAKFIKDPGVTVEVVEFRPFYILGEVDKPGAYPYIGGLNVLSALAIAGGRTFRANQTTVLIQHVGETVMHEYDADGSLPILPGDIIQVPRRYI